MSPFTHGLLSWMIADALPTDRRGRIAVTVAGVAPDLDGLGAPVEMLSGGRLPWFSEYHHVIFHNGLGMFVIAGVAWLCCRRDWRVGLAALAAAHLHLLCDLVGSRGPDGHNWSIPYFLPFSHHDVSWSGQWALNAWPNMLITVASLVWISWLATRRGRSPLEIVSPSADAVVVERLRAWWRTSPSASLR